jgi:hypothetical protein
MSEQVITDRAEALRLAPDEADEGSRRAAPVTRPVKVSPASPHPPGDRVACPWCGAFSCPGPGCDSCGSPLTLGVS